MSCVYIHYILWEIHIYFPTLRVMESFSQETSTNISQATVAIIYSPESSDARRAFRGLVYGSLSRLAFCSLPFFSCHSHLNFLQAPKQNCLISPLMHFFFLKKLEGLVSIVYDFKKS